METGVESEVGASGATKGIGMKAVLTYESRKPCVILNK